jgi:hypothetical protein
MLRHEVPSTQSTPSRSHAASCVTVHGDSDEDYHRTPIKQEQVPAAAATKAPVRTDPGSSLSRKNRLLAKAQSEWMLSTLKEEHPQTPVGYVSQPSYSRNSLAEGSDLCHGYPSGSREYLQQHQLLRDREMMAHAAMAAREIQEREREFAEVAAAIAQQREREREQERERERERDLARGYDRGQQAALAHQKDYDPMPHQSGNHLHHQATHHRVAYHPPTAHAQTNNYRHSPPGAAAAAVAAAQHQSDFYAAAAAAAVAAASAPTAVYVTTAGYQPIAISHPPPAHHSRHPTVLAAPPPAHPLPAHVQPAAAALFPAHPQMAPTYSYAPLSPGKTQYLY